MDAASKEVLESLYRFQQDGTLCDVNVAASDGTVFMAHAGILAASSPYMASELANCQAGHYHIETSLSSDELQHTIQCVYTGSKPQNYLFPESSDSNIELLYSSADGPSDDVVHVLKCFAQLGLFCDTMLYGQNGQKEFAHSYMLAAKASFLTEGIKSGGCVSIIWEATDAGIEVEEIDSSALTTPHRKSDELCAIAAQMSKFHNDTEEHEDTEEEYSEEEGDSPKMHQCPDCDMSFRRAYNLKLHGYSHTGEKPYVCELCDKKFSRPMSLSMHVCNYWGEYKPKNSIQNTKYHCEECDIYFRGSYELTLHNIQGKCKPPKKDTTNTTVNKVTKPAKKSKPIKSEKAPLHSPVKIKTEKPFYHSDVPPNRLQCDHCKKTFTKKEKLRKHLKKHKDEFLCEICGATVRKQANVEKHIEQHVKSALNDSTDDSCKKHICSHCGLSLNGKVELQSHLFLHTGEKPYECTMCNKTFTRQKSLAKHLRKHDLDDVNQLLNSQNQDPNDPASQNKYLCSCCGLYFRGAYELNVHVVQKAAAVAAAAQASASNNTMMKNTAPSAPKQLLDPYSAGLAASTAGHPAANHTMLPNVAGHQAMPHQYGSLVPDSATEGANNMLSNTGGVPQQGLQHQYGAVPPSTPTRDMNSHSMMRDPSVPQGFPPYQYPSSFSASVDTDGRPIQRQNNHSLLYNVPPASPMVQGGLPYDASLQVAPTHAQQLRDIGQSLAQGWINDNAPAMGQHWTNNSEIAPNLSQRWANMSCLMGANTPSVSTTNMVPAHQHQPLASSYLTTANDATINNDTRMSNSNPWQSNYSGMVPATQIPNTNVCQPNYPGVVTQTQGSNSIACQPNYSGMAAEEMANACQQDYSGMVDEAHTSNSDPCQTNVTGSPKKAKKYNAKAEKPEKTKKKKKTKSGDPTSGSMTDTDDGLHKCDVCDEIFSKKQVLRRHMRVHASGFLCEVCGESFRRHSHLEKHLDVHVLSHISEDKYNCPTCGLAFSGSYELKLHEVMEH